MSLRQFVCVGGEGAPASVAGAFPHTHKLAKTLKNGLTKMGLLFCVYSQCL